MDRKTVKTVNGKLVVEMEWEKLEGIAHYYGFPSSVFFLPKEKWAERKENDETRLDNLIAKAEKVDEIRAILDEEQTNEG